LPQRLVFFQKLGDSHLQHYHSARQCRNLLAQVSVPGLHFLGLCFIFLILCSLSRPQFRLQDFLFRKYPTYNLHQVLPLGRTVGKYAMRNDFHVGVLSVITRLRLPGHK
jgi:hypothetical protein